MTYKTNIFTTNTTLITPSDTTIFINHLQNPHTSPLPPLPLEDQGRPPKIQVKDDQQQTTLQALVIGTTPHTDFPQVVVKPSKTLVRFYLISRDADSPQK